MSLARSLLIRASRSRWLERQVRRRAFTRRAVRRFMPGEGLEDALGAAARLASGGIGTVLTCLGERVATPEEAAGVCEHYRAVLDTVRERALPSQVSVKLTHLGLDVDREGCARHVLSLAARAAAHGSTLWIDMEESHYVDATLDVYRRALAAHRTVGVCLQAYLHRTPADLDALLPHGPSIRLVKGAYREPPSVALARRADVDARYLELADRLLAAAARPEPRTLPVFGTHDMRLVREIRRRALGAGVPARAYEVHMLYGIRADDQRALAADGCAVRTLISYGTAWFPWYMRRLAEKPSNVWFVVRSVV
jgi:proline dehydrogenase